MTHHNAVRKLVLLLALFAAASGNAWSQESRGSITGTVTDPQNAVIPGAAVVITNTDTNVSATTTTNQTGYFEVNLLNPGKYTVSVESAGFKKSVKTGLELNVAGRLSVDFRLEVGVVTESVEVTAAPPLLDTTTATGGRVLANRDIMQLPSSFNNPFVLTALTPGMQWTGAPGAVRPYDFGGASSFDTAGNVGQNEYTIDGAPVTGTARRVGFIPPSDAVTEFKIQTASFDASYGHTSGASINVMSKAGTNTYHGSLYDQHQQNRWNAMQHFSRLAREDAIRKGAIKPSDPKVPSGRTNNGGVTIGGPVRIPKIYNGRDKLFFFFSYNGIFQKVLDSAQAQYWTIPKMPWRQGDFSDMLALDATKYQIYDPRSARLSGSTVVRTPFPGNKGIPILNPAYNFYTGMYPKPNDIPGLVNPDGTYNYLGDAVDDYKYYNFVNRYDYNISSRHHVFGRWLKNNRAWQATSLLQGDLKPPYYNRGSQGGGGSWVWTISNSTVLNFAVNYSGYTQPNSADTWVAHKPTDVGLPGYLDDRAGDRHMLPSMGFQTLINGVTGQPFDVGYPSKGIAGWTGETALQMITVKGSHSLKYGWQERRYWYRSRGEGYTSGSFSFDKTYMRPSDSDTKAANQGLEWAAFMMGLPTTIRIDSNDSGYWSTRYRAFYLHDDWRVSSRLRLNLGLRYEREGGDTERFNRGISGGFFPDMKLPFTDAVQAAYALSPLPELPAAQFRVLGGTEYLGTSQKTFTDGTHKLLPRAGVVYELNRKTVLRGGYGWFYDTFNVNNTLPSNYGYSLSTTPVISTDNGLSFCCSVGDAASLAANRNPMLDPFPLRADGTRFDSPYRNQLGSIALAGRGLSFTPRNFSPDWQQRWRIGVQREITSQMMLDISYNGAYSKQFIRQTVSYLPQQYWATGNVRNQAVDDAMNQNVPNPFNMKNLSALQAASPLIYNYLNTQSFFKNTTIRKNQLLRAFPQMSGLNGLRPGVDFVDARGGNRYHDVELLFERRFSRGLQSSVMYTYTYNKMQDFYYNEFEAAPSWRPAVDNRPHRFVWTAIYELPFGKGRSWVQSGPLQHVVGGWQLSWIYQYQRGPLLSWGNRFFYGDINQINDLFKHDQVHAQDMHLWFDPSIAYTTGSAAIPSGFQGFEGRSAMQPGSFHVRVFPSVIEGMRQDAIRNWDVKILRSFRIVERARASFAVDLLNATNHTILGAPNLDPTNRNFGRITAQNGFGRQLQFNMRIDF